MIAKRIDCEPQNDDYARLAHYCSDARHAGKRTVSADMGEKALYRWFEGCEADSYALSIKEVCVVQRLNTRTQKEKTYHLMLSFHPEDEEKLTEEVLKEIEQIFSKALGFSEHQRHCGVHKNTNNLHMHVAINMIHPQKLTRFEPFRDFLTLSQACRVVEQAYGIKVDNGMEKTATPKRGNTVARTVEAHTGQQSFDGYVQEHKEALVNALQQAHDWSELHQAFARFGLEYALHGNGAGIKDRQSKKAIKASSLGREFSKPALEKRFGSFQGADPQLAEHAEQRFTARPLQQDAERDGLYQEYMAKINERKERLANIRQELTQREREIRELWQKKRAETESRTDLLWDHRRMLCKKASTYEREMLEELRGDMEKKRLQVREEIPFWHWSGFLQMQAESGNELALKMLRARLERQEKEEKPPAEKGKSPAAAAHGAVQSEQTTSLMALRQHFQAERRALGSRSDLISTDKKRLQAVSRIYQLQAEQAHPDNKRKDIDVSGITWTVDSKGTVLFQLPTGGLVRDSAEDITFSAHDPHARKVAQRLASMKFGKGFSVQDCVIKKVVKQELQKEGLGR